MDSIEGTATSVSEVVDTEGIHIDIGTSQDPKQGAQLQDRDAIDTLPRESGDADDAGDAGDAGDTVDENHTINENESIASDLEFVNIKDFAYDVSDPRHFGIYPEDNEDDLEEEYDYDDDDEDDDDDDAAVPEDSFCGVEYNKVTVEEEYIEQNNIFNEGRSYFDDSRNKEVEEHGGDDVDDTGLVHAVALYPFVPENSNELSLEPDQHLIINYECGDGWLVAYDPATGQTGLVPSEYIYIVDAEPDVEDFDDDIENAQRFMPEILGDGTLDLDHENSTLSQKFNDLSV